MALTTRTIVLERLGLASDADLRGAFVVELNASAHTTAEGSYPGGTVLRISVDSGANNDFTLADYDTIAELITAINDANIGVACSAVSDTASEVPPSLIYTSVGFSLTTADTAWVVKYNGSYATGNATLIDRLITEVDYAIGRHCNRIDATTGAQTLESAARDEKYDGCGESVLSLRNYPVSSITSIALVSADGTSTTLASTDYTADLSAGRLRWNGSSAYWSGWSEQTGAPAYGYRPPGWPEGFQNIQVQYTAGYSTVPADLRGVATAMCVDLYMNRKKNSHLSASGIGDKSDTYRSAEDFITQYVATLAPYWRPVL